MPNFNLKYLSLVNSLIFFPNSSYEFFFKTIPDLLLIIKSVAPPVSLEIIIGNFNDDVPLNTDIKLICYNNDKRYILEIHIILVIKSFIFIFINQRYFRLLLILLQKIM